MGFTWPGDGTGLGAGDGDGSTCPVVVVDGGLLLSCGYLASAASGGIAAGGYAWPFSDSTLTPPGGSTACLDLTAFCGAGTSVVQSAANFADPYGGGLGVSLNQAKGSNTAEDAYSLSGTEGISYAVSDFPVGLRLIVGNLDATGSAGTDYCVNLTEANAQVSWTSFNTMCWNPGSGTQLTGPPLATHIEFEVTSSTTVRRWNFCVTTLSFF
jgi:hypothetical protein